MTSPDFVPAMKLAAAIVTDQGELPPMRRLSPGVGYSLCGGHQKCHPQAKR